MDYVTSSEHYDTITEVCSSVRLVNYHNCSCSVIETASL